MLLTQSKHTEKKSKFLGLLYKIEDQTQAQTILNQIQTLHTCKGSRITEGIVEKEHKKANHVCAAILTKNYEKFFNDKEVGQPGKLLLTLLKQHNQTQHLIIVIRYFGGIKLGQGGVQRAFKTTAKELF